MCNALTCLALVAGAASIANAAAVGNIVFTSKNTDAVMYYNNGVVSTLVSGFGSADDIRLSEILRAPSGEYYVGNGPFPINPNGVNTSAVFRIDNVFAAVPAVNTVKSGFDMANVSGMAWHNSTRNVVYANNAQSEYGNDSQVHRGVRAVHGDTGVDVNSFQQTVPNSYPAVYTTNDVTANPYASANDYYLTCINGGNADFSSSDASWSSLWHYNVNPGDMTGTPSLMVNLGDTSATGLSAPVTFARSTTLKTSTNEMFITNAALSIQNQSLNGILRVKLNNDGTFNSISLLFQDMVNCPRPDAIEYNPFTDKIVFSDEVTDAIYQINPDGTGFELVAANTGARGFYFVPAPGAAALAGLAGLAAARRRRA
ncbi:MAG: hypothetical protein IT435_19580 [Phycisphaerales bacterium]|nr:hypothetical protein [Phycisphaerales bacterium]